MSLVTKVYSAPGTPFIVIVSVDGSMTNIDFADLRTCKKGSNLNVYSEGVDLKGQTLTILPGCECRDTPEQPCSCSGAAVYQVRPGAEPRLLKTRSLALTKNVLGVRFIGREEVIGPKTSRARIAPPRRSATSAP